MRFPIRIKMFILVLIILVGATSAVVLKTRSIFLEDKFDFVKQLTNKLSSSTAKLVNEKFLSYQSRLAIAVSTRESLKKIRTKNDELSKVIFERNPDFALVSVQKEKDNDWATEWSQINYDRPISKWADSYSETLLRSLDYSSLKEGAIQIFKLADPDGAPIFAMVLIAEISSHDSDKTSKNAVVGLLSKDFLIDVVNEYKGDLNSVFVIDDKGYVVSHPDQDMIGKELNDNPIMKEIVDQKRVSGVGEYTFDTGVQVGSYQSVNQSNLFVIATTPMKQALQAVNSLMMSIFVFGLGFLIIGLVLAFFVASKITRPLNELQETASVIGSGDFQTKIEIKSDDEVGELAKSIDKMRVSLIERDDTIESSKRALVQSEKMSAFGQLSAGIAHEVKNPLAGILGHAQLAKSKTQDSGIVKHMDIIEKEARRTKEIVENLMKFARAEKPELAPIDLHEAVSRAVDLVDHQLSLQGIKVSRHLDPVKQIVGNANQIQQVLLNIMMNASHAMEDSFTKVLDVYLEDKGETMQIRIKDSGKGMTPEVQKRIFEPFFTTKPAGKGTGLGLSVSYGIVQDHKAKVYVESAPDKGATFFIDFPKAGSSAAPVPGIVQKSEEPQTKAAPAPTTAREQMSKDYRSGIDEFDKNRGIVTHVEPKGGEIPNLDLFKKPVSDPDKIEMETEEEDDNDIMYSDSSKAKSKSKKSIKDDFKIVKNETTTKISDDSVTVKVEKKNTEEAPDTGGFKVKIRKSVIKG